MPYLSRKQLIKLFTSSKFAPDSTEGQSYIVDYGLCQRIGDLVKGSDRYEGILEIGPGFGAFTDFLIPLAEKVIIVEKDPHTVNYLKEYYKHELPSQVVNNREIQYLGHIPLKTQLTIVSADFFTIPIPKVDLIISNVPYVHVVDFMLKLVETWTYQRAILILQREVVDHLIAQPSRPGYTLLSVITGFFFTSRIVRDIQPKSFYPQPKVSSVLVELTPTQNLDLKVVSKAERVKFTSFLQAVMPFKEKHLKNVVPLVHAQQPLFAADFPKFEEAIEILNLNRSVLREMTPQVIYTLMQQSCEKMPDSQE